MPPPRLLSFLPSNVHQHLLCARHWGLRWLSLVEEVLCGMHPEGWVGVTRGRRWDILNQES